MSMSPVDLKCDKCGHQSDSSVVWGQFVYLDGDKELSINRRLSWCHDCENFVPVEDFEDINKLISESKSSLEVISNELLKPFRLLFRKTSKVHWKNHIDKFEQNIKRFEIISNRRGTEKCLHCGSMDIERSEIEYKLHSDEGDNIDFLYTLFFHPKCGGEYIATRSSIMINTNPPKRIYNLNGKLLEKCTEKNWADRITFL